MQCPKCHTIVDDKQTVCPKCHKVLLLECPNCHALGENSVCQSCGYTILVKCSKCSKTVSTSKKYCTKCGFETATSVAYQECESDEFASLVIKFNSLKKIRALLKSQELYSKFYYKLKNLLYAQIKGVDCKFITYNDTFVVNLNKELSLATSANKAVRLALKIINAFTGLNSNVIDELTVPLNLNITVIKKTSEKLLDLEIYENNVKLLATKKSSQKYLKGMQVVLDEFTRDEVNKDYKTDSLYSLEENNKTIMFYEVVLDSYVVPPSSTTQDNKVSATLREVNKPVEECEEADIHSFKVFDINAKCTFSKTNAIELINNLKELDLNKNGKIVSIKTKQEYRPLLNDIENFYQKCGYRTLKVSCREEMNYKPWGFFEIIFRDFFNIPIHNRFIKEDVLNPNSLKVLKPLFDLLFFKPVKSMSPEDARFTYMEYWNKFLSILSNTVVIVENFDLLDDTSIQTLELYFDKFKNVKPNFVFITSDNLSVHSKIKGLLRTNLYTEFKMEKVSLDSCLETLKCDATDFIQSFYYEKIKENFRGSYLYFKHAIQYLKDAGVLLEFENKLIIKNKKSIILGKKLNDLLKARIKHISRNMDASLILAYTSVLGSRLDSLSLESLGIKDVINNIKVITSSGLATFENGYLYINEFDIVSPIITNSLKREAEQFLAKNVLGFLGRGLDDATLALVMGKLSMFKDEYLTLWKNSKFAINTGDFDAYLKNCLGFLSLVEHIESNITKEDIDSNKLEVYNNILLCLYSYSPEKIYNIENVLLMDAIDSNDDEKIVKLSNLMLQGALISSNYTDALGLLHNILSRMPQATMLVNGEVNSKFLLLSLVNIEILYNIGDFYQCIEIADSILEIITMETIEKVKPVSFSTNLFVSHIIETMRLVALAKLYTLSDDLEEFFLKIKDTLKVQLPEMDCIIAIRDYLEGKVYSTGNIEDYSAYSKVIFLLLQEFSELKDDYKRFAQNIYQAKLLSHDLHQREIEMLCDLLIAYAYSKMGINKKAEFIYQDIAFVAEKSAMFNILIITKFLFAKLKQANNDISEALVLINDSLALIKKYNNQSKILYGLLQKLYVEIVSENDISGVDIESENLKLNDLNTKLVKILN